MSPHGPTANGYNANLGRKDWLVPPRIATVAATASATTASAAPVPAAASAAFATVTTTTTAAAAFFITATAAAAAALIARAGFIDTHGPSIDGFAVELGYGILGVRFRGHRHKGKSPGFPREFILHEQHFGHSAGLRKHVLQLELRRRERQVAYVQSISHN